MKPTETAAILAMFASSYPAATVTEQTATVWADLLEDVNPDDGLAAAKALIKSSKFFPSIAEFREASRSARRIRTGNPNGVEPQPALQPSEDDRRIPTREEVRSLVAETKRQLGRPGPVPPQGAVGA